MSDSELSVPTIEPGTYEHFKGKRYHVIGVALHSETQEPMVVYKPLYDSPSEFWVRPYDMFTETVERDGRIFPRFRKIDG
jgi:hypothetical protein